jgi:hypothetical protein
MRALQFTACDRAAEAYRIGQGRVRGKLVLIRDAPFPDDLVGRVMRGRPGVARASGCRRRSLVWWSCWGVNEFRWCADEDDGFCQAAAAGAVVRSGASAVLQATTWSSRVFSAGRL